MAENRTQILEMLSQHQITVEEAERLLSLIQEPPSDNQGRGDSADARRSPPKYLRVVVEPDAESGQEESGARVNVRVPIALLRAGVKLAALIPKDAVDKVNERLQQKGVDADLGNFKVEDLAQIIDAMADLEVDVQGGKHKVRVYVE